MNDLYVESQALLELIANSVYDRESQLETPLFFSIKEIHLVEAWLLGFRERCNQD